MDGREHEVEATYGVTTGEPIWSTCRCHSSHVYASLQRCPRCGHRSLDPGIGCERRKCGYEEPDTGTVPSEGRT